MTTSWQVPFFRLKIDDEQLLKELLSAIEVVLRHGHFVLGPEVQELERRIADNCGRRFGVALNSGTTALWLALKALGLTAEDEVITTPLSWVATANAIAMTGATPMFADIGDDLNLDPATIEQLITPRTRAIVPVHYTGKMCNMEAIEQIATAHGLLIVEDAAQAFGATHQGRRAGSIGAAGCFSMNAMKVFAACGDAGMVLTDREDIRERLIRLRYNGTIRREECVEMSLNGRMDPLQAAILLQRLASIDEAIERRRQVAAWYTERLDGVVCVPRENAGNRDVWYTYQIRLQQRDELKAFLEERGIEARVQHPILMPDQPIYRHCRRHDPNAQRLVREILCLPLAERMTLAEVEYVCNCVRQFCEVTSRY